MNLLKLKRGLFFTLLAFFILVAVLILLRPSASTGFGPFYSTQAAPFPKGLQWLNVSEPLTWSDLKGRVVILDFWTYGCINCMHMIPVLHDLEKQYGDKLVVVGVHTPKFENEKNIATLKYIVKRYELRHPIIQDVGYQTWQAYNIKAWPTIVVINPQGKIVGSVIGDGEPKKLRALVARTITQASHLSNKPLAKLEVLPEADASFLKSPGKVTVAKDTIAISDTLHNRIVLTDTQGNVKMTVGSGSAGLQDGDFSTAKFNKPQGIAFASADKLYVADTLNHTIRLLDLTKETVTTVAGNGKRAWLVGGTSKPRQISLNSPWGLVYQAPYLYIAMAGNHQIWRMNIEDNTLQHFAGNGREGLKDGPLAIAEFSQPSGLSIAGHWLIVADTEDSAVRRINLKTGIVFTLIGKGLFVFGDRNGPLNQALLQHDLGVAAKGDEGVFVADTYNHQVKYIDFANHSIATVVGTGQPGIGIGKSQQSALNEPGGLYWDKGKLYIADTNNNRIVIYTPIKENLSEFDITVPEPGKQAFNRINIAN